MQISYYINKNLFSLETSIFIVLIGLYWPILKAQSQKLHNIISYVTEEIMFCEETFVFRYVTQFIVLNNVRLNCVIKAKFFTSNAITYSCKMTKKKIVYYIDHLSCKSTCAI